MMECGKKALAHPSFPTEELVALYSNVPNKFDPVRLAVIRHPPSSAVEQFRATLKKGFTEEELPGSANEMKGDLWKGFIQPFLARDKKGVEAYLQALCMLDSSDFTEEHLNSRVKHIEKTVRHRGKGLEDKLNEYWATTGPWVKTLSSALVGIIKGLSADAAPDLMLSVAAISMQEALEMRFNHATSELKLLVDLSDYLPAKGGRYPAGIRSTDLSANVSHVMALLATMPWALGIINSAHLDLIDNISYLYKWDYCKADNDDERLLPLVGTGALTLLDSSIEEREALEHVIGLGCCTDPAGFVRLATIFYENGDYDGVVKCLKEAKGRWPTMEGRWSLRSTALRVLAETLLQFQVPSLVLQRYKRLQ
jgi:hypothetical protein